MKVANIYTKQKNEKTLEVSSFFDILVNEII